MFNKTKFYGSLAGLGFLLSLTPNIVLAQEAVRPWRCSIAQGTRTKTDVEVEMPASAGDKQASFRKLSSL